MNKKELLEVYLSIEDSEFKLAREESYESYTQDAQGIDEVGQLYFRSGAKLMLRLCNILLDGQGGKSNEIPG